MGFRYRDKYRGSVWAAEIIAAYQKAFNIPWWRMLLSTIATALGVGGIFRLADATYERITDEDEQYILAFLEKDKTDLEKYVDTKFDCDDFEARLIGAVHKDPELAAKPIFSTWVEWWEDGVRKGHALLSYVKDGIVKMVEPQDDNVYDVPWKKWQLSLVKG